MNLYQIINLLQNTSSTNEKQSILESNRDNMELVWYLKHTYCPSFKYYIAEKTYPTFDGGTIDSDLELTITSPSVIQLINEITARKLTGGAAVRELKAVQNRMNSENADLLRYLILGDARISIGAKQINKVWDKLLISVPYNRCDLLSEKTAKRIDSEEVILQLKGDGVFGVLVHHNGEVNLYTRNGSRAPQSFAQMFNLGVEDVVVEGEIIWYDGDTPLERKVSNGISNSVFSGGEIPTEYSPKLLSWNHLTYKEWEAEKSVVDYKIRLSNLVDVIDQAKNPTVALIETHFVSGGMAEVLAINNGYLNQGLEGSVVKFSTAKWAFNTNKEMIKIKVEVEIDMIIDSVEEATGKNAGMAGRINVRSQDGRVVCGVNSMGTAAERTELWENKDSMVGKVIVVKCNDILTAEGHDTYSLFLGRAHPKDVRFDKNEGDDITRIQNIFESAGVLKNLV